MFMEKVSRINFLKVKPSPVHPDPNPWVNEKKDILDRANWLEQTVITSPSKLLQRMPYILGEHYRGEWAIYSCSMYCAALSNICRLYPEEKELSLSRMRKLIDIVLQPELRQYDTKSWGEDAMETLEGDKSHMTYLSILAWMITLYKMSGGGEEYDRTLHEVCAALYRRTLKSRDLNLLSFPQKPVFLPDMLVTIVALHNYSLLYGGMYADTVSRWLAKAKNEWLDKRTGLLVSMLPGASQYRGGRSIKGSHSALSCYYLSLVDEDFAREQYERLKKTFRQKTFVDGIKEYQSWSPKLKLDVNAGPIIFGFSPSGTVFSIGAATYFGDWEFRAGMLETGRIAGVSVTGFHKRHYLLGDIVVVGEAATLAMRTNLRRSKL